MFLKHFPKPHATVFALIGELGAGKTTFVQKFALACGVRDSILSPTFTILKKYGNIVHIDAYRLNNENDLAKLDFDELLQDPSNVIFVEWADRVQNLLPDDTIVIRFEHLDHERRKIHIN